MDFQLTRHCTYTQVETVGKPPAPKMLLKLSFTIIIVAFVFLDWEKGRKDAQRKQKPKQNPNH